MASESASKKARLRTENELEERMKVKGKLGIEDQILMINDKCLEDNKRIEDYIIKSETFIELRFDSTEWKSKYLKIIYINVRNCQA